MAIIRVLRCCTAHTHHERYASPDQRLGRREVLKVLKKLRNMKCGNDTCEYICSGSKPRSMVSAPMAWEVWDNLHTFSLRTELKEAGSCVEYSVWETLLCMMSRHGSILLSTLPHPIAPLHIFFHTSLHHSYLQRGAKPTQQCGRLWKCGPRGALCTGRCEYAHDCLPHTLAQGRSLGREGA